MKKILTVAAIALAAFADNYAGVQITNDTLAVNAKVQVAPNNIYARGAFLYNDRDGYNNFYSVGVQGEGNLIGVNLQNVKFSLIVDFVHTKDNSAIPLGVGVFGYIPNIDYPVFVRAEAEYAPKILSFDDADRFSRFDVQTGVQPIENGELFVGYRNISFNHNYDSGFYAGIGYHF
jgi:hypothetical protein